MRKIFLLMICVLPIFAQETSDYNLLTEKMVCPTLIEEARINYNKGTELLHENKYDEAELHLLKAIELDPYFCDAMDHLGLVYRRQNRLNDAIEIYQKSISLNNKNYAPHQNLAIIYRLQKRYEDARQEYLKIIDIDKDNPESYYGIGQLYYEVKMYEECITFMQIALQKYYERESIYVYDAGLNIAYANYQLKNYEEALKYFKFSLNYYKTDKKIIELISEIELILKSDKFEEEK